MSLLEAVQRSPEWYAARKGKITASVAAACLGLNPYKGWLAAFNEITGRNLPDDNSFIRWGVENEAKARHDYEMESGNLVFETGLWVHQDHSWLAASPDSLIGTEGLLEIKCPQQCPAELPVYHEVQCRIQMAVTDRFWCDYRAWTPEEQVTWRILRDISRETELIRELKAFYDTYIFPDIAPPRRRTA